MSARFSWLGRRDAQTRSVRKYAPFVAKFRRKHLDRRFLNVAKKVHKS
jgi:hypothetical protein